MPAPAASDEPSREPSRKSPRSLWRLWIAGLRPRTLPASIAPVVVGASAAWIGLGSSSLPVCPAIYPEPAYCAESFAQYELLVARFWPVALLCGLVALLLQIAVNFANDYSDGIRGTDARRGGAEGRTGRPQRLTASGLVRSRAVLAAAGIAAGLACAAGLAAIVLSGEWGLLLIGAASLLAGWTYTGGRHPYGYAGFGEVGVFLFFGLAAVLGTQVALMGEITPLGVSGAVIAGLLACVMLMVNNLRDIDDDRIHGKRTLAVRLGELRARRTLVSVYGLATLPAVLAAMVPLANAILRWAGADCSAVSAVPGCPAGSDSCPTAATTTIECAAPMPPSAGVVLLGIGGAALLALAVLFLVSVRRRDFGRMLALSGFTSLAFAAIAAGGAVMMTLV